MKYRIKETIDNNSISTEDYTIIEGRDQYGKLHDLWFDETDFYIERAVKGYLAEGWSEFSVVQNPRKYKLTIEQ